MPPLEAIPVPDPDETISGQDHIIQLPPNEAQLVPNPVETTLGWDTNEEMSPPSTMGVTETPAEVPINPSPVELLASGETSTVLLARQGKADPHGDVAITVKLAGLDLEKMTETVIIDQAQVDRVVHELLAVVQGKDFTIILHLTSIADEGDIVTGVVSPPQQLSQMLPVPDVDAAENTIDIPDTTMKAVEAMPSLLAIAEVPKTELLQVGAEAEDLQEDSSNSPPPFEIEAKH